LLVAGHIRRLLKIVTMKTQSLRRNARPDETFEKLDSGERGGVAKQTGAVSYDFREHGRSPAGTSVRHELREHLSRRSYVPLEQGR
jgi:hypothetical protein